MIMEYIIGIVVLLFFGVLSYGAYLMVCDSERRYHERKNKRK